MSSESSEARERIDRTKPLTLDERVQIVTECIAENHIDEWQQRHARKLAKSLEKRGYEPMMFQAAFRIWLSRQRKGNEP